MKTTHFFQFIFALLVLPIGGCTSDAPRTTAIRPLLAPSTPAATRSQLQGWQTYTNAAYGFSFRYPSDWRPEEAPNFLRFHHLQHPMLVLTIGFRRQAEDAPIQRTGVGAGDIVTKGTVTFFGRELSRDVLLYQGKEKAVLYNYALEVKVDELVFTLSLDDYSPDYASVVIGPAIQAQADEIIESFELTY